MLDDAALDKLATAVASVNRVIRLQYVQQQCQMLHWSLMSGTCVGCSPLPPVSRVLVGFRLQRCTIVSLPLTFAQVPEACDVVLPPSVLFPPRVVCRRRWPAVRAFLVEAQSSGVADRNLLDVVMLGDVGVGKSSTVASIVHFHSGATSNCTLPNRSSSGRTTTMTVTTVTVDLPAAAAATGAGLPSRRVRCVIRDVSGREADDERLHRSTIGNCLSPEPVAALVVDVSVPRSLNLQSLPR